LSRTKTAHAVAIREACVTLSVLELNSKDPRELVTGSLRQRPPWSHRYSPFTRIELSSEELTDLRTSERLFSSNLALYACWLTDFGLFLLLQRPASCIEVAACRDRLYNGRGRQTGTSNRTAHGSETELTCRHDTRPGARPTLLALSRRASTDNMIRQL
jgi:hypothetical protein